jgi:hypothetical protein
MVVSGTKLLPTSRALAFVSWRDRLGRLEFTDPSDPDVSEFFLPRIIEAENLTLLGRERKRRVFPQNDAKSLGLYLGLKLSSSGGVAIFVAQKQTASSLAEVAVDIYGRDVSIRPPREHAEVSELRALVRQHVENLSENCMATRAAQLGIFSHHGNTPHGIRLAVEHAMKQGLIRLVVCTSTLAQGVNLPIRYLIITGAQQGAERIKTRDFHNLLGRAGRSGMYTEGTIIFSDPRIYDGRHTSDERWRWSLTKALLDPSKSEECRSALLSVLDPFNSDDNKFGLRVVVPTLVRAHIGGVDHCRNLARRWSRQYEKENFICGWAFNAAGGKI